MKRAIRAIIIATLTVSAAVAAGPVSLPRGPLYFDYSTAEQYSKINDIANPLNPAAANPGEGNWGIIAIDSISVGAARTPPGWQIDQLGPAIFTNGPGAQILGIFYGVQNNPLPSGSSRAGTLDLYHWENSTFQNVNNELSDVNNLNKRSTSGTHYDGFTCQPNSINCTFLARFQFSPGADLSSAVNTIFSVPGTTYFETYMNVDLSAPGAWTGQLNSGYFTLNPAQQRCGDPFVVSCNSANDIRADGDITAANGGWNIATTDIISFRKGGALRAVGVPEPGSLALVMLALAVMSARRAQRPRAKLSW